jgi:hypothetical protein
MGNLNAFFAMKGMQAIGVVETTVLFPNVGELLYRFFILSKSSFT